MKKFMLLACLLSNLSFAEDSVSTVKELTLNFYKDSKQQDVNKAVEKHYKMLITKALPIKSEREKLVNVVNSDYADLGVQVVSLDKPDIISIALTAEDYSMGANESGQLKCESLLTTNQSLVLFETQSYRRSTTLAFGARFAVNSISCLEEDKSGKLVDERVLVKIEFIDFIDLDKKISEI
jgi:hypothetical protein